MKPMIKLFALSLFFVSFSSASSKSTESTESFLKKCFKDYTVAFAKPDKTSGKATAKVRKRCLTEEFANDWKRLVAKSDTDALLLAQDFQQSWKTHVQVKDLNESNQMAKVVLGKTGEEHCVFVKYTLDPAIKISAAVRCAK